MNELPERLREHSHHVLMDASRELLRDAATEIERLRNIIKDYAIICQASSRQIAKLQQREVAL